MSCALGVERLRETGLKTWRPGEHQRKDSGVGRRPFVVRKGRSLAWLKLEEGIEREREEVVESDSDHIRRKNMLETELGLISPG